MSTASWPVQRRTGSAAALHDRPLDATGRLVTVCEPDRIALVLGSTQDQPAVAAGRPPTVDVVRRRSGGGAVLVAPGAQVWIDVDLPRGDPLWDDDVGRSFLWLGRTWAAALDAVGVPGATVHEGALVTTAWSRAVCFAGLGPGEVTVGGRKVVGIAQRRTRAGARFQSMVPLEWGSDAIVEALGLPDAARADLADAVAAVDVAAERLVEALVDALVDELAD